MRKIKILRIVGCIYTIYSNFILTSSKNDRLLNTRVPRLFYGLFIPVRGVPTGILRGGAKIGGVTSISI